MICEIIAFDSPWILKMYALRQKELRVPLGLNLFEEDLLSEQDELFFIGYENEELITCLQMRKLGNGILKLRQMATDALNQGQGRGKELVHYSEQWAARNGYQKIELHARQVATGFYNKLGYKKEGEVFLEVDIPHYKMVKYLEG